MHHNIKKYYIAYFDILGYKHSFEEGNDIASFLESNIRIANEIVSDTASHPTMSSNKIKYKLKSFSDNFMIIVETTEHLPEHSNDDLIINTLTYLVSYFQFGFLEKYSILLRGSITKGDLYFDDNIVFGEGLIRAVSLEEQANYPRIIIDTERIDISSSSNLNKQFFLKDSDDKHYVNFFEILGFNTAHYNIYSDNIYTHIENLKKNIIKLINKHGKYKANLKSHSIILQYEKRISKYTWLLLRFNEYCSLKHMNTNCINYETKLNPRFFKYEILVPDKK